MSNKKRLMAIMVLMIFVFTTAFSGCSNNSESSDADSSSNEQEEGGMDSLYGNESLGIDPEIDKQLKDYRTIIIAGIDNIQCSDIIIVLAIHKKTNTAKFFTVARDSYMQLTDGEPYSFRGTTREFSKCNRAYSKGGRQALIKEMNRHLDINATEFIGIDWATSAKVIDAFGGLEVDVPEEMLVWTSKKDNNIEKLTDEKYTIDTAGPQTLTGWQAVQYLRVRKYKGGNARVREARNTDVFKQLYEKAKKMSPEEIAAIYDEVADDIDTNMSRNRLTDTLALIATVDLQAEEGWPYQRSYKWDPEFKFNYLLPDPSHKDSVIEMHARIYDKAEEYVPSETMLQLSDRIDKDRAEYLQDHPPKKE